MTLVSHRYKFISLKNKKVGGSSVEAYLGRYCVDPNKPYDMQHKRKKQLISKFGIISHTTHSSAKWRSHIIAKKVKNYIGSDIFKEYYKFSIVRNPWDRIVSLYFWRNGGKTTFKKWIKTLNTKWDWGDNWERHTLNDKPICDYYIRYENLYDDISKVCDHLGIKDYNLNDIPHYKSDKRKNKKRYYQEYYNDETKKIVEKYHKKEIDYFGYEF